MIQMYSVVSGHSHQKNWINKLTCLSYFENPRNTHDECEESRKVRGQYLHEHGDVVKNICKKPAEITKENVQKHQTGQTVAAAPHIPPLFGLRVEFGPGNKDKSHQRWTRLYSHRFIYHKIFTLSSMQRGFFHTCRFHLQRKQPHTLHEWRHVLRLTF